MESFSGKRAFVFGDATHTVGIVKFLHDELAMPIAGAGTYLSHQAAWVQNELDGYLPGKLLVTDRFQEVTSQIEELMPELVCGTQMERHSCRKLDLPCLVIAPPTHIENHLLSYNPMLGFDGADHIADKVYTTATLGLEKHLLDMFGDAGLTYNGGAGAGVQRAPGATGEGNKEKPKVEPQVSIRPDQSSTPAITWSPGAETLLSKVPFFVRNRVRKKTEQFAAMNKHSIITEDVLQAAKDTFGG
jgi:light-independent protochlorophyllide reductase subunit B